MNQNVYTEEPELENFQDDCQSIIVRKMNTARKPLILLQKHCHLQQLLAKAPQSEYCPMPPSKRTDQKAFYKICPYSWSKFKYICMYLHVQKHFNVKVQTTGSSGKERACLPTSHAKILHSLMPRAILWVFYVES